MPNFEIDARPNVGIDLAECRKITQRLASRHAPIEVPSAVDRLEGTAAKL